MIKKKFLPKNIKPLAISVLVPPEGIEPPSTVPKTVVLSIKLQGHVSMRSIANSIHKATAHEAAVLFLSFPT